MLDVSYKYQQAMSCGVSADVFVITYIISEQVWVVCFDAVVEDGDDDALAREAVLPCRLHIHVQTLASVLQKEINTPSVGIFN